jgi:tRNA G18 (ribose-2'-O)-methylase SpoU
MTDSFEIRICENPACGLRYPLIKEHPFGLRCPACLGSTIATLSQDFSPEPLQTPGQPSIRMEALLDNIRSAWNVGAIFRTADGFGVEKLYLCGITPSPGNPSLRKTALGADATVQWAYTRNALETALKIKNEGAHLWALEQDKRAIPIHSHFETDDKPVVLIVGNEVSGVDPALLDISEQIVYIPMLGKKRSLNVEVAFGAAMAIFRNTHF